jgi:uncharacterized lipoprotein YehR (DUF1307 family)
MNKKIALLVLGAGIVLASCDQDKVQKNQSENLAKKTANETASLTDNIAVNPLIKELDVPFKNFKINTSNDTSLTFGKLKTKINIPANCFVFEDGTPVEGNVQIDYREIRTAAEIMLSGITMKYDSSGTTYDFQTAGMFDIRGYKNNKPIKFANGKSIQIEYDSNEEDDNYNFYCLDENKANWDYLSTPKVEIRKPAVEIDSSAIKANEQALAKLPEINIDSLKKTLPIKPQLVGKDQEIWDFEYDYINYPQFKRFTGVMWQYYGDSANNPLKLKKNITWTPTAFVAINDAEGIYKVKLKSKNRKIEMKMRAVYMGEHYTFAQQKYKQKLKEHNAAIERHRSERNRLMANINQSAWNQAMRAQAIRTMNINGFGVYNCDRYYRQTGVKNLIAKIDTSNILDKTKKPTIFLVANNSTVVINVSDLIKTSNFIYSEHEDNKLVMIHPSKEVSTFSKENFRYLKLNPNNSLESPYLFDMTLHEDKITSAYDLDVLLKSI